MGDSEDNYSTDESGKKRKASNKEIGGFTKSRKTPRTPTKSNTMGEEKLDIILRMMKELKEDQKDIKNELQHIRTEQETFNEEIKKLKQENSDLKMENEMIKKDNKEMKEEMGHIKRSIEWLEKDKRKNNVILNGLSVEDDINDLKRSMKTFFEQELKIDVQVKAAKKLNIRSHLIELESEEEKAKVMQNKIKLKNIKSEKIFIDDDLTKKEREKQRHLRQRAKAEKEKGKIVKMGYNELIIDGVEWRWDKKLEKLSKN